MGGNFDPVGQPIASTIPSTSYGWIILNITPGDASFDMELYRSPDNGSGGPNLGAEVLVATYSAPVPQGGVSYQESGSLDGAYRHFRYRHVRSDVSPGNYTPDLRVKPVLQGPIIMPPILPASPYSVGTPYPAPPAATLAGDPSTSLIQGKAGVAEFANGEFDNWEYY